MFFNLKNILIKYIYILNIRFLITEKVIDLKMDPSEIYLFNTFLITKLASENEMLEFTKLLETSKRRDLEGFLSY